MADMQDVAEVDKRMLELSETVSSAFYILQDAAHQLKNELDEMEFDSNQLQYVEDRLAIIKR